MCCNIAGGTIPLCMCKLLQRLPLLLSCCPGVIYSQQITVETSMLQQLTGNGWVMTTAYVHLPVCQSGCASGAVMP